MDWVDIGPCIPIHYDLLRMYRPSQGFLDFLWELCLAFVFVTVMTAVGGFVLYLVSATIAVLYFASQYLRRKK